MNEATMLGGIGYLLLYMYLAFNFLMLAWEKKIKFKSSLGIPFLGLQVETLKALFQLMNPEKYPSDYKKARIYGLGALAMIIFPIIWFFVAAMISIFEIGVS